MSENINQPNAGMTISTGNEIGRPGKIIAGFLFILFTLLSIFMLIAFWPDRLPKSDAPDIYTYKLFNIYLLDSANKYPAASNQKTIGLTKKDSVHADLVLNTLLDTKEKSSTLSTDSANTIKQRASDSMRIRDSLYTVERSPVSEPKSYSIIHLNTLLMILVATAGFMGTLIHLASSFTNYVGSEKFKKSWILWYVVKPFTGAALAIVFYFIFRAGLLNFNDSSNINLYGIITLAALAGLFTDKATMKLEELFSVLFRTKDERPDKINSDEINMKVTGIKPENLLSSTDNQLMISGEGLDKRKLVIKVDDDEIKNPVIKSNSISFTYKIPDATDKKEFLLRVFDEQGKEIYSSKLMKGQVAADAGPATGISQNPGGNSNPTT